LFYWLAQFGDVIPGFNVFRYITFRTGGAVLTALLFVFLFGPAIIALLRVKQGRGQPIRADGPASHLLNKKGTPTMGGLMILSGLIVSVLLWANLSNPYVWVVLGVTISFGLIGLYDDYLKVTRQTHAGFSAKFRLVLEVIIAAIALYAITRIANPQIKYSLAIPFLKDIYIWLG
jgi:phospho-N-acetylmuramoyl-pentapeptide-transferase